jgi:FkbM family methyltransferase
MKKFFKWVWYKRFFPILWRFPYGGLCLVWPDEMGIGLVQDYESGIWGFLQRVVEPGWNCLDLGANQGFYTILLSRLVGAQGSVVAFEPLKSERRKLAINLALNGTRSKLKIESLGVSEIAGTHLYYKAPGGHASRSGLARPPEEVGGESYRFLAKMTTLDSYVTESVDLIKIDIEGGEKGALAGGVSTISRYRPLIVIEIADVATRQFSYPAQELVNILTKGMGYVLFEENGHTLGEKDYYRETCIALPKEKVSQYTLDGAGFYLNPSRPTYS